jgi:hypothetical protein
MIPLMNAAERFFEASQARDLEAASATLAADVVMLNPVTDDAVTGREAVTGALQAVEQACDEFHHTQLLQSADDHDPRLPRRYGLVFEAQVGDSKLHGVDLLELDDEDRIKTFTVLARPMAALMALGGRMSG